MIKLNFNVIIIVSYCLSNYYWALYPDLDHPMISTFKIWDGLGTGILANLKQ